MLKQLLIQIETYQQLNFPHVSFDIIGMVVTRLYQVETSQLTNISQEELHSLVTRLLSFNNNTSLHGPLLIYLERALTVLEHFREVQTNVLQKLEDVVDNCISDLQRQSQKIYTPQLQPKNRIDTATASREMNALVRVCNRLHELISRGASESEQASQCEIIDKYVQEFYVKQFDYWRVQPNYQDIKKNLKENIKTAMRQGVGSFQEDYEKLIARVKIFQEIGFFEEALELLNYQALTQQECLSNRVGTYPLHSLLNPLIEFNNLYLNQLKSEKPLPMPWRTHRQALKAMRQKPYSRDIEAHQAELMKIYLSIIRAMLTRAEAILGPPPISYCLIAFGSLSRGDVHAHSDVEAGAIISDTQNRALLEYLQNLIQLWKYEMEALGESDPSVGGFHFDTGGISVEFHPKEIKTRFIYDIPGYVKETLTIESVDGFARDNTLLRPLFLFGDEALFKQSQQALPNLSPEQLKPVLQRTAKILNAANPNNIHTLDPQQLKDNVLHPLIWAISQLALHYHLPKAHSSHPIAMLAWLGSQTILDPRFVQDGQQALKALYEQRLKLTSPQLFSQSKTLSSVSSLAATTATTATTSTALTYSSLSNIQKVLSQIDRVIKPLGLFLTWLSQDKPKPLSQPIHPGYYPESNGKRYLIEKDFQHWQQQLNQQYIASTQPRGIAIRIKTLFCGEGWLCESIVNQLSQGGWLTDNGQFNLSAKETSKTRGRHLVIPLLSGDCPLYLKVYPEMPGIEYAASRFNQLLIGLGLPFVEIARIEINGVMYPVLLSQAIEGLNLEEVLSKQQISWSFNERNYSEAFITAAFLNQEDGKPDNYKLKSAQTKTALDTYNTMALYSIDNDRCFYPAALEEREGEYSLINKTIAYCFKDFMQKPFDKSLSQELLSLEPYLLLQTWLQDLANLETQLRTLFTEQEIKGSFQGDLLTQMFKRLNTKSNQPPESSLLLVPIREHLIAELYYKFLKLQEWLTQCKQLDSKPQNKTELDTDNDDDEDESESIISHANTCLDLLKTVEPFSGYQYESFLNQSSTASACFNLGPGKYYGKSQKDIHRTQQTLPQTLNTLQGKPIKVQNLIEREREYFTKNALKELATTKDAYHMRQSLIQALMNGEPTALNELESIALDQIKEMIINQLDFQSLKTPFAALLKVMEKICYLKLKLKKCPITLSQLNKILKRSPYLKFLSLKNILQTNDNLWELLNKRTPRLEQLTLDNLNNLGIPQNKASTAFFNSSSLQILRIRCCPKITTLNLNFPQLKYLSISNCDGLVELSGELPKLELFNVKNSTSISDSALTKLKVPIVLTDLILLHILKQSQDNSLGLLDMRNKVYADINMFYSIIKIINVNKYLTRLNLKENDLGYAEIIILTKALNINQTLTWLNLSFNELRDDSADAIAEMLRNNHSLAFLDLENNRIGAEGAGAIAEALKENHSLTEINLASNSIYQEGSKQLFKVLRNNRVLNKLNLKNNRLNLKKNSIFGGGFLSIDKPICKVLAVNKYLTFLDLSCNNLSPGWWNCNMEPFVRSKSCKDPGYISCSFALWRNTAITMIYPTGDSNAIQILTRNRMLQTNLFEAIQNNQLDEVQTLIQQGVSLWAKDKNDKNNTLLHASAKVGHSEILKYLLNQFLQIHSDTLRMALKLTNEDNKTPEQVAREAGYVFSIADFLASLLVSDNPQARIDNLPARLASAKNTPGAQSKQQSMQKQTTQSSSEIKPISQNSSLTAAATPATTIMENNAKPAAQIMLVKTPAKPLPQPKALSQDTSTNTPNPSSPKFFRSPSPQPSSTPQVSPVTQHRLSEHSNMPMTISQTSAKLPSTPTKPIAKSELQPSPIPSTTPPKPLLRPKLGSNRQGNDTPQFFSSATAAAATASVQANPTHALTDSPSLERRP